MDDDQGILEAMQGVAAKLRTLCSESQRQEQEANKRQDDLTLLYSGRALGLDRAVFELERELERVKKQNS